MCEYGCIDTGGLIMCTCPTGQTLAADGTTCLSPGKAAYMCPRIIISKRFTIISKYGHTFFRFTLIYNVMVLICKYYYYLLLAVGAIVVLTILPFYKDVLLPL